MVAGPGRPAALYIAQKRLSDANFGHRLIHHLDAGSSLDLIERAARQIVKIYNFNSASKPDIELAIDGQLSNWVIDPENNQILSGRQINLDCIFRIAAPGPVFHHPIDLN